MESRKIIGWLASPKGEIPRFFPASTRGYLRAWRTIRGGGGSVRPVWSDEDETPGPMIISLREGA